MKLKKIKKATIPVPTATDAEPKPLPRVHCLLGREHLAAVAGYLSSAERAADLLLMGTAFSQDGKAWERLLARVNEDVANAQAFLARVLIELREEKP